MFWLKEKIKFSYTDIVTKKTTFNIPFYAFINENLLQNEVCQSLSRPVIHLQLEAKLIKEHLSKEPLSRNHPLLQTLITIFKNDNIKVHHIYIGKKNKYPHPSHQGTLTQAKNASMLSLIAIIQTLSLWSHNNQQMQVNHQAAMYKSQRYSIQANLKKSQLQSNKKNNDFFQILHPISQLPIQTKTITLTSKKSTLIGYIYHQNRSRFITILTQIKQQYHFTFSIKELTKSDSFSLIKLNFYHG